MLYDKQKILDTVVLTSCESKRSGYVSQNLKSYLRAGICQNRLSVLALQINFDVDFYVELVKDIFCEKQGTCICKPLCTSYFKI